MGSQVFTYLVISFTPHMCMLPYDKLVVFSYFRMVKFVVLTLVPKVQFSLFRVLLFKVYKSEDTLLIFSTRVSLILLSMVCDPSNIPTLTPPTSLQPINHVCISIYLPYLIFQVVVLYHPYQSLVHNI